MKKLFLDIETIPAPDDKHETLKFLHKKALDKNKKEKRDFEQYLVETSFNGAFGRILCIGYAINDEPTEILYDENEKEMLKKFWEIAKDADLFIGHNILDFDLRFIYQRSVINGVKPTRDLSFARYRNDPIYDTSKEWSKWSNFSVGLEHLALAFGIPTSKDGIDGSLVYGFYKAGKIEEILIYCKKDVETTREIYKRMTFS
jgi:hypothetical protein